MAGPGKGGAPLCGGHRGRVVRNPRPSVRRAPIRAPRPGTLPAQRLPANRVPQAQVLLLPLRIGAFPLQLLRRDRRACRRRLVIGAAAHHGEDRQHQQPRSQPPPPFLRPSGRPREPAAGAIIGRECRFNSQTESSSQHIPRASAGQSPRSSHRSRAHSSAARSRNSNRRGWRSAISAIMAW